MPPEEYFDCEFKQIDLVWLLNLCPPGLGIGTLYACGPGVAFFLLFVWAYLIFHHASWEPILQAYLVTSIIGTLGCVHRNMKLKAYLESLPVEELESGSANSSLSGSFPVLSKSNTKEKETIEPDTILLKKAPDEKEVESVALKIEEALKETDEEIIEIDKACHFDIKVEAPGPIFEPALQVESSEIRLEEVVDLQKETALDIDENVLESEDELLVERKQLMDKLASATGEFQPQLKEPQEYENFDFSQSQFEDSFKFEVPEFNFENVLSTSEKVCDSSSSRCQCGREVNNNFSFCLACGKNFKEVN